MIEVNASSVTINKGSTGVILKLPLNNLPDVFVLSFQHSALTCENLCVERIGKSYGTFVLLPVPNTLVGTNGTISVNVDGSPLKVNNTNFIITVQDSGGSSSTCTCDADADRAAIEYTNDAIKSLMINAGDTIDLSKVVVNGYISGGTTSIGFSLFLGRPINANNLAFTGDIGFRGVSGYLNGSYTKLNTSNCTFTLAISSKQCGIIWFEIAKSSAFTNVTNNTPVTGFFESGAKLTFS